MPNIRNWPDPIRRRIGSVLASIAALSLVVGCNNNDKTSNEPETPSEEGPLQSVEAAANAPSAFSSPRAGVPLDDGSIAFIATLEGTGASTARETGERIAILRKYQDRESIETLYSGDLLANPLDLAVSLDGETLYIADPAGSEEGTGALLSLPVGGGEPSVVLSGVSPRAVTVADDGSVYFSGSTESDREPAVFVLNGSQATPLFTGAPLVDPSGIAVERDGAVLVADTRLFDGDSDVNSEAGIIRIEDGVATVFASGFATGYPAGVALTQDGKSLIISGQGKDRSDTVYLVDMANPELAPREITASFSKYQDSAAGLHRAHGSDTFVWASLAADGGTVYKIIGNSAK